MKPTFTDDARRVLSLAQDEARQLNHEYVGTEHLLLALLIARPSAFGGVNVSAETMRREIESLVQRGTQPIPAGMLPLTPRAQRVLETAHAEARIVTRSRIDLEHLTIGLMQQADGVAGQAMQRLGLDLAQVRETSLKLHLDQMRLVERAVRPVRATMARKRKMREELLAHLAGIVGDERSRHSDPNDAFRAAAMRFGDPAVLASELETSLPRSEAIHYAFERLIGWRAPESASRYLTRLAFVSFTMVFGFIGLALLLIVALHGWHSAMWVTLRIFAVISFMMPVATFVVGSGYFGLRDRMWGALGRRKSHLAAAVLALGVSLFVGVCEVAVYWTLTLTFVPAVEVWPTIVGMSASAGISCWLIARVVGPTEIRDTLWSCLDLRTAS